MCLSLKHHCPNTLAAHMRTVMPPGLIFAPSVRVLDVRNTSASISVCVFLESPLQVRLLMLQLGQCVLSKMPIQCSLSDRYHLSIAF